MCKRLKDQQLHYINITSPSFCFTSAGLFLFFPHSSKIRIMPRNYRNSGYKKLVSWKSQNKLCACKNVHYVHVWRTNAPKYSQCYHNCGKCNTWTFLCLRAEYALAWRFIKKKSSKQSVKSLQELQRAVVWNGLHQSCSHSAALLVLPISGG